MSRGRGAVIRLGLLALLTCALLPAAPAAADDVPPRTYQGPAFSRAVPGAVTESESQSKLWFHAGAWWALLSEPPGRTVRVHELMPDHTWRPTPAVVSTDATQVGDAFRDGDAVHVVMRDTSGLQYARLTFDPEGRDYRVDAKQRVTPAGGNAAPMIAEDSSGRLWVGFANGRIAAVSYSDDAGMTWSDAITLSPRRAEREQEVGALIAYDDRVGFLWSNQATDSFEFASHRVGDPATAWSRERAHSGTGDVDNHVSLVVLRDEDGPDTLVAAIKTSQDDAQGNFEGTLVSVLIRTPDGQWTGEPAATVADDLNDPMLQVDAASRSLYLFASSAAGDIVVKQTPLDDIRFEPGLGDLFVLGAQGDLRNPTGSKEPVTAQSGLVILASDEVRQIYRHGEAPLGDSAPIERPDDSTAPEPPVNVRAGAVSSSAVVLSWSRATDGNEWVPAGDAPPVSGYVVFRDGQRVASLEGTTFRDEPRSGGASEAVTVVYQVRAVDGAGNRSAPVEVAVTLPPAPSSLPTYLGIAALMVAGSGAVYRLLRRRVLDRRMADGQAPRAEERPLERVGGA